MGQYSKHRRILDALALVISYNRISQYKRKSLSIISSHPRLLGHSFCRICLNVSDSGARNSSKSYNDAEYDRIPLLVVGRSGQFTSNRKVKLSEPTMS